MLFTIYILLYINFSYDIRVHYWSIVYCMAHNIFFSSTKMLLITRNYTQVSFTIVLVSIMIAFLNKHCNGMGRMDNMQQILNYRDLQFQLIWLSLILLQL
jgi:hypothetical protein